MRGDTIVAINDVSISQVPLASALASLAPGAQMKATLARRGVAYTVDVTLGRDPSQLWWLTPRTDATPDQLAHRTAWLR